MTTKDSPSPPPSHHHHHHPITHHHHHHSITHHRRHNITYYCLLSLRSRRQLVMVAATVASVDIRIDHQHTAPIILVHAWWRFVGGCCTQRLDGEWHWTEQYVRWQLMTTSDAARPEAGAANPHCQSIIPSSSSNHSRPHYLDIQPPFPLVASSMFQQWWWWWRWCRHRCWCSKRRIWMRRNWRRRSAKWKKMKYST